MIAAVTIDVAGGPAGGAARFRTEVCEHVETACGPWRTSKLSERGGGSAQHGW